ncbi:hypothetical protein HYH03_009656 [Edaphochlamys debaryana]|uniref:ER membrane protein complex subunit 7 beta-sandwich domain-containing protein n=1 Tax=Edaphochlamys debaryana TaxID=47281 RepID=A0A836BWP9_9CHLO|nr:hypothetical protein HYH03_009656 [Edaphochlamys debaryana]|eukprot:KAG2491921.1 hypothetical protein HYH03_009656 [Edaphochlamys debaryana]
MHLAALCLGLLAVLGLASADEPFEVAGRVIIPPTYSHATTELILRTQSGEEIRSYVDSDGSFAFRDLPPGIHTLQPFHLKLVYPEFRLEISRKGTLTRASLSHNRQMVLQAPLVLRPAMEAAYYEKRKPFDLWGFVKSPYGLMIMFSLFAIIVFPRMKMDPEDYKEMQEAMRVQGSGAEASGGGQQRAQPQARLRDR